MAYEKGDRVLLLGKDRGYILKVRTDDNGVPLYDVDLDRGSGYANDYCVARECELKPIDPVPSFAPRHPEGCDHGPEEQCQNCRAWWGTPVSRNDL